MTAYGKLEYWEERYKRDAEPFDWFQRYAGLKPILLEAGMKPTSRILVLGCGTSRVSEELHADGFVNLMNIDFSSVCISHMQKRCADRQEMKFLEMNALDMNAFAPQSFDIVFDKGTMDCILCGDNSFENVQKMLREVSRVLAAGGSYVVVSYGQPNFRLSHLQREEFGWAVVMKTIQKPSINVQAPIDEKDNVHYVYICTKAGEPAPAAGEEGAETAGSGQASSHAGETGAGAEDGDGAAAAGSDRKGSGDAGAGKGDA